MPVRLTDLKQRFQAMKDLLDDRPLGPEPLPLEIRAAALDAVEQKVEILGINRRAFPYSAVRVLLLPSAVAEKPALERAFADFDDRVRARLTELLCDIPQTLAVTVSFVRRGPASWEAGQRFAVEFVAADPNHTAPRAAPMPRLQVTVIKGTATKKVYVFNQPVVTIGRTAEVRDTRNRTRRNQVAFDQRMSSVSRAHATVKYNHARTEYRLLDDGSARGTRVVRGDKVIEVPRDPRGVRIEAEDEIRLGDVAIRVAFLS